MKRQVHSTKPLKGRGREDDFKKVFFWFLLLFSARSYRDVARHLASTLVAHERVRERLAVGRLSVAHFDQVSKKQVVLFEFSKKHARKNLA